MTGKVDSQTSEKLNCTPVFLEKLMNRLYIKPKLSNPLVHCQNKFMKEFYWAALILMFGNTHTLVYT